MIERFKKIVLLSLTFSLLFLTACDSPEVAEKTGDEEVAPAPVVPKVRLTPEQEKVKAVTDSENLLQSLATKMRIVSRGFSEDLKEDPDFVIAPLLARRPSVNPKIDALFKKAKKESGEFPVSFIDWPNERITTQSSLHELFDPITGGRPLEDVQLGVVRGHFITEDEFEMNTKLEARFTRDNGNVFGLKGQQMMRWRREDGEWKLYRWNQEKLQIKKAERTLFADVTESAIPDEGTRKRLQRSSHEDLIRENVKVTNEDGHFKQARPEFACFSDWYSAFQYPSVSVLDIDSDGFDDLFVTDRWQPAQMLRNRGDGTFEDWTEQCGLVINELANCVYFADFDNDGDADAFVGISMGPSRFYKNENGKFALDEENTKVLAESRFVSSASIVDINRDGLLDLYINTYAFGDGPITEWYHQMSPDIDQLKTLARIRKQHQYVDRGGPPNIILMNRGGKFEWSKLDDVTKQFRDSYQTSWIDLDDDGDLDVYVCNDFAMDAILRNDTERGSFEPKFTDISSEIVDGEHDLNFAMGASLGDFDNDADLDLYVSNMYSKAGKRICSQIDSVDRQLKVSARGNFLYENKAGKLKQVAGPNSFDQNVATVGWSYAGQFADFDNDGNLDIYVPSGLYSPPEEVHTDKDL